MSDCERRSRRLYLIEFLHQTTTRVGCCRSPPRCILLNFYIKPQPMCRSVVEATRCILLNFYIKPQLTETIAKWSYRCILLNFYIKPQPGSACSERRHRCILLNFYIKPQPPGSLFVRFQCFMPFCPAGKSNAEPSSK